MKTASILAAVLLLILPTLALAGNVIMNNNGFIYSDGTFPLGAVGDKYAGAGFVSSTSPPISADLSVNELTWSLDSLLLTDQLVFGDIVRTFFAGGIVGIYLDPAMNAEYGINPPNATCPSTFEDGDQFLIGVITMAAMQYNAVTQSGVLQAVVDFTNGTALPDLPETNGNIVEFVFGPDDLNIPPGFDLQALGSITAPALCTVQGDVRYECFSECEECDGITQLVLEYTGSGDLTTVTVSGGVSYEVQGNLLIITAGTGETALPDHIQIQIGCDGYCIDTSCERPLDPGNAIGPFVVVTADKIMVPCEQDLCEGITSLTLLYLGIGNPDDVLVSDGAVASVVGDIITITPTGDKLPGNITVKIRQGRRWDKAQIHTSCSQPLEVGFVFGEYEVVAVEKIISGDGVGIPTEGPVVGATVDLVDGEGNMYTTLTDENGHYVFYDVATTDITVSMVVPLGYYPVSPTSAELVLAPGDVAVVDFLVECAATQDKPRSVGFWKHQVNSALKGKQKGVQVPADLLITYFNQIHDRFDQYFEVFIPVVTLEDFRDVLSVKGGTMYEKGRKQFAALLLNVVSNRLATWQFISDDNATVSQAITYVGSLLMDGDDTNDELAKDIAEIIVNDRIVPAGMIPLDIGQIAYTPPWAESDETPSMILGAGNYPNPFNPTTTIAYELRRESPVSLAIYNVAGQKIRHLIRGEIQAGLNEVTWDGRDNAGRQMVSGVYFYRLKVGAEIVTNRIVMIR
jgi:hypothetical protein